MGQDSATAVVSPRGAARLRAGHPWVYRPDVVRGPAHDAGDGGPSLVSVEDGRRKRLGWATWAARARLALRMIGRGAEPQPPRLTDIVEERLGAALKLRLGMGLDRDAYRVAHAESDGLPGLVVDRYADAAVLQTTSVAMNAARAEIAEIVRARLDARVVVARDDGSARDHHPGVEACANDLGDLGARGVHRHGGRLEDGGVGVAIDHQPGETVALGVGDAVGVPIEPHSEAQPQRGAESLFDDVGQPWWLRVGAAADHPQCQPGSRCPGRPAEPLAAPVLDRDQRRTAVAGVVGRTANDVGAVNPGVAGAESRRAAWAHHGCRRILAHRFAGAS